MLRQNRTEQNRTEQNGRNSTLDVLKGILIIFVIVTHYKWTDSERLKLLFPFWIDMAVPVFMIISGFLYAKSFEKHGIIALEDAYETKALLARVVRFTVPFAIAFCVEESAYIIIRHDFSPVKSAYRFLVGGAGPGSYYYPVMIQFIFYFPVIFFIIKKNGEKGFAGCIIINFVYELLQRAYGMNEQCYRMLVFRYTFVIAFGCYLALNKVKIRPFMLIVFESIGLIYIIVFKYTSATPPITIYWTGTSYIASMYIVPIAFMLIAKTNISFKPLEILGKASFEIFLVQMVWYVSGAGLLYKYIGNSVLQLVCCVVICCIGGVVFNIISEPIVKKINSRIITKKLKR